MSAKCCRHSPSACRAYEAWHSAALRSLQLWFPCQALVGAHMVMMTLMRRWLLRSAKINKEQCNVFRALFRKRLNFSCCCRMDKRSSALLPAREASVGAKEVADATLSKPPRKNKPSDVLSM